MTNTFEGCEEEMRVTRHAEIRAKQRGIRLEFLLPVLENSRIYRRKGGAWKCSMPKKVREILAKRAKCLMPSGEAGRFVQSLDKLRQVNCIISDDASILTVFHAS